MKTDMKIEYLGITPYDSLRREVYATGTCAVAVFSDTTYEELMHTIEQAILDERHIYIHPLRKMKGLNEKQWMKDRKQAGSPGWYMREAGYRTYCVQNLWGWEPNGKDEHNADEGFFGFREPETAERHCCQQRELYGSWVLFRVVEND